MKPFVNDGCVQSVVLWNPVDLGYAAVYAMRAIVDGELAPGDTTLEAGRLGTPLLVSGEEWQAIEQHGRMVFQDEDGLLDLALPKLPGRHQIENAGTAVRALRVLERHRLEPSEVDAGLANVDWPGRMQRLGPGPLRDHLPGEAELWLDGGHNPAAGAALAMAMSELEERVSRPLVLVVGMISSKDTAGFLRPFAGLASRVITLTIPGEENAVPAGELAAIAREAGMAAQEADSLEDALKLAGDSAVVPRILICGSLYLAGRVLAAHGEQP
jgi:dihydrofolate synthase/folylpolyglutamate synthase